MGVFQLLAFASGILVARGLGPAGQGRFQLLISITVFTVGFAKLGLDEGVAYLLAKYKVNFPQKVFTLIVYALSLTTAVSLALGAFFFFSADLLERVLFKLPGFAFDLRYAPLLFPVMMLMLMGMAVLRGLGRSDLRAYVYYYGVGGSFLLLLLAFYPSGLSNAETYLARTVSFALGAVLSLLIIGRTVRPGRRSLTRRDLRELHTFSGYLIFVSMFQYVVEQPLVDLVLVSRVSSAETVGIYSVASRAAVLVGIVTTAMTVVMAPVLAEYVANNDEEGLIKQYTLASEWMARLSLFAGIALLLMRNELLGLFGSDYQEGMVYLVVFLLAQTCVGLLGLNTPILLASGYAWLELLFTGLASILMVVLGLLLGRTLGPLGIAFSTGTSIFLLAAMRRLASTQLFNLKGQKTMRTIVVGLLSGGLFLFLHSLIVVPNRWITLAMTIGFTIVYWGISYLTGMQLPISISGWKESYENKGKTGT